MSQDTTAHTRNDVAYVTASSLRDLRAKVSAKAQDGYMPVGGPTTEARRVGPGGRSEMTRYIQAMYRPAYIMSSS